MRVRGRPGLGKGRVGAVARVGVTPENQLWCAARSVLETGQGGLFCRGHSKAAEPTSPLLRVFWEPTSRGRQGQRDGRHGWAGTSPVGAAEPHSSCRAQLGRGATFLPPKPCRNSSPSSHRGHPPAHGVPPTPHRSPERQSTSARHTAAMPPVLRAQPAGHSRRWGRWAG